MKRMCRLCGVRRARAVSKKRRANPGMKQRKGHDICRQCFESLSDAAASKVLESIQVFRNTTEVNDHGS